MSESVEKVVAATKIPRGAKTSSFALDHFSGSGEVTPLIYPVQVGIWTSGEIQPLNTSQLPSFWPKLIKISPDCHVQNVRLSRVTSSKVVLQATKDIQQGQELLVWFDENLLMDDMGIPPYLNPTNIRGGNSYVCHLCSEEFEAPNNLKIHIALKCSTLPTSILWSRLCSPASNEVTSSNSNSPCGFHFLPTSTMTTMHQYPSTINMKSPSVSMSMSRPIVPILMPPPQIQMGLLPLPPRQRSTQSSTQFQLQSLKTLKYNNPHKSPNQNNNHENAQEIPEIGSNGNGHRHRRDLGRCTSVEKSVTLSDPQAQLESIVSNMGKARNGHMCLYCGKLYSRKYGLKIHIRTHTGYKPLRCRICHRPFGDPSNLNKHIRLHSDGNTPYRCDVCNKVLVRKRDLERHIRSRHSGPVPDGIILDCTLNGNGRTPNSTP